MANTLYVLCIDDDEDDCNLLKDAIHRQDSNVSLKFYTSGQAAIDFLNSPGGKDNLPKLIILDVNMPGMDGKNTLAEIQKITRKVPVIFLTTTPREHDILFGERNGATLVKKPTSMAGYDDLATTIVNLFT